MKNQQTILDTLRDEQTPYWALYDGSAVTARSGETTDIEESIERLRATLAQLPPGTYRLKAANHPKKHNGAAWHDITNEARKGQPQAKPITMTGQSTNPYGIPDNVYMQIQQETERNFMFKQMYQRFMDFDKEWPDFKRKIEQLYKDFYEDSDGNGIADFAENVKHVASAADSISTAKKVFTGSGLFGD